MTSFLEVMMTSPRLEGHAIATLTVKKSSNNNFFMMAGAETKIILVDNHALNSTTSTYIDYRYITNSNYHIHVCFSEFEDKS